MDIVFISTHNLATNPRLVKEIRLAVTLGYRVSVICFNFRNWSNQSNEDIISRFKNVEFHLIDGGRENYLRWFKSVFLEKIYRYLGRYFTMSDKMLSQAVSRRSNLLLDESNKIRKVDLVIGRYPGSIYPVLVLARKFNCKAGFDVEDYHPGEGKNPWLQRITLTMMKNLLPQFDYVSFSSKSIMNQCIDADKIRISNSGFVVSNVFPESEFIANAPAIEGKLKFVWFSQYISFNRGLERIIPIITKHASAMELHLYGQTDVAFEKMFLSGNIAVTNHGVVSQQKLHSELALYDIGLAIEPGKDLNNDLAVSNKLFAYLQSGLLVVATATKGQGDLLNSYPENRILIRADFGDAGERICALLSEKDKIRQQRNNRIKTMRALSWENQSSLLEKKWKV